MDGSLGGPGPNPSRLPLAHHAVFLKGHRADYLCERLLKERGGKDALRDKSSAALTEAYSGQTPSGSGPPSVPRGPWTLGPGSRGLRRAIVFFIF